MKSRDFKDPVICGPEAACRPVRKMELLIVNKVGCLALSVIDGARDLKMKLDAARRVGRDWQDGGSQRSHILLAGKSMKEGDNVVLISNFVT